MKIKEYIERIIENGKVIYIRWRCQKEQGMDILY